MGSEGTLDIITHVAITLNQRPQKEMLFDAYLFNSFEEAAEGLCELEQSGSIPHLARISDEKGTLLSLTQLDSASVSEKATKYLELRGVDTPCMVTSGFAQADLIDTRVTRKRLAVCLLTKKCVRMSSIPGMAQVNHRLLSPYPRGVMVTRRVGVNTLETTATWDNAATLRHEIAFAIETADEGCGTPTYVFYHISHVYESGCSLYFTYFFRETEDEIFQQWMNIKTVVSEAMTNFGDAIMHHHGTGQDHNLQYYKESTELFDKVTRVARDELDPTDILNPSKLATGPHSLEEHCDGNMI